MAATTKERNVIGEEVVERVESLLPLLRERSPEGEERRRLPDEVVKEIRESGLGRMLQPVRYGGLEAHPRTFFECVLAIAAACGSAGWVSSVVGVHPWQVAQWPDQTQAEVWGDDPDTWISSSYMPGGMLTPVEGGYRLTGRWGFSSGCDHCQWVILGSPVAGPDGAPKEYRNTLLRLGEYVIEDVWDTVGLRGTGSNDIVVDDLFVPEHRTLDLMAMFATKAPGLAVNAAPLFKMPFATLFSYAITGPIIGMAEGMLTEGLELTKKRVSKNWGKASDDPFTVAALGESACEIDACRLQLFRNLDEMMDTVTSGVRISIDQRSRARRDQVMATQRAVAALDDIFDRSGAPAILKALPMQRIWRDAHAARHHTINTYEKSLQSWGLVALGGNPTDMMV